jgi:hypothetical protein
MGFHALCFFNGYNAFADFSHGISMMLPIFRRVGGNCSNLCDFFCLLSVWKVSSVLNNYFNGQSMPLLFI